MVKQPPFLISFHYSSEGPGGVGNPTIAPHYFTERDHPWVKLFYNEFLRFQGKSRREVQQHFEGHLPFESPEQKRKFLLFVLERLSQEQVQGKGNTKTGVKAQEARSALFLEAARHRIKAATRTIVRLVSLELKIGEVDLMNVLFSDLLLEQMLPELSESHTSYQLTLKANLILVQRLLHKSALVRIHAFGNIRRVVRQAKLRKLICHVTPSQSGEGSVIEISGPLSLFGHTALYGRALAELVPLLFWCHRFSLSARCRVKGRDGILKMSNSDPILPATEPRTYDSKLEARFAQDFLKKFPDWNLIREPDPFTIPSSPKSVVFPDFKLQHRRVPELYWYLEIVGYWTPQYLKIKIERLELAKIKNLILCVDETLLCGVGVLGTSVLENVLVFKKRIRVELLDKFLQILASTGGVSLCGKRGGEQTRPDLHSPLLDQPIPGG